MRIRRISALAPLLMAACANPTPVTSADDVQAPLSAPLPDGVDPSKAWRLMRDDGLERPCQIHGGRVVWIDTVSGTPRRYRIEPGRAAAVVRVLETGNDLTVRAGDREALRYAIGRVPTPDGVDPLHAAAGFIHPLRTPSGLMVTDNFPTGHPHHHGIWSAWRKGEREGRPVNGFAPLEKLGRMEVVAVDGLFDGPVVGGFRAKQRLVDLSDPDGPTPALEETWDVRVYAVEGTVLFDIDSTQACAGGSAFTVLKHGYGGMGFRGPAEWAGKDGVAFLTSEGRTRIDGDGRPARWVVMNGRVGGKDVGVGFLCHPSSLRAPQPTRLNPERPYFSWVPAAEADLVIRPGEPVVSRYRFVVADRRLSADEMERHWTAFATPGPVELRVR